MHASRPAAVPALPVLRWLAALSGALLVLLLTAHAQPPQGKGLPEAASQGMAQAAGKGQGAMQGVTPGKPATASAVAATPLPTGLPQGGKLSDLAIDPDSGRVFLLQASRGWLGQAALDGTAGTPLPIPHGADRLALDPPRAQVLVAAGRQLHFIDLASASDPAALTATPLDATDTAAADDTDGTIDTIDTMNADGSTQPAYAPAIPMPQTAPTAAGAPSPDPASDPRPSRLNLSGKVQALAIDADHARALLLTSGRPNLHLVDTARRRLLGSWHVPHAGQLALDPRRGTAWLLTDSDQLLAWHLAQAAVKARHSLPFTAGQLAIDASVGRLVFTSRSRPRLLQLAIDDALAAGPLPASAWRTLDLPAAADALAIDPELQLAVVSLPGADAVGVLELASGRWHAAHVRLARPGALAIAPMHHQAVVLADQDTALRFDLPQPVPELQALTPAGAAAGSPALTLALDGRGFTRASKVSFGPLALVTRYVSPTRLEADVPANALAYPGPVQLRVHNPAPAGGDSQRTFTVRAYAPELTALAPAQLVANGQPQPLQLLGRQFQPGARVQAGDQTLAADRQSATTLVVQLPGALLQAAGQLPLQVVNPDGQSSAPLALLLTAPPPALTLERVVPAAAAPGATVSLEGRGFASGAGLQLSLAGQPVPILALTSTTLTVTVPADASSGAFVLRQGDTRVAGPWFEVIREQDFALTASPGQLSLAPGARRAVTVQLVSRGTREFEGLVSLSVAGLPEGLTAELSRPALGRAQPVTLTLAATGGAGSGTALPSTDIALSIEARAQIGGVALVRQAPLRIQLVAAEGARAVQGRFVTPAGQGIAGVRVRADLGNDAGLLDAPHTVSDAGGNFQLDGLPPGSLTLRMDATPAHPQYPIWPLSVTLPEQGVLTLSDWTLAPPPLDAHYTPIDNTGRDQPVSDPRYPGFAVVLPAGVTITGWDGVPKQRIAIERLSPDQLPVSPPPFAMKEAYQLHFGSAMGGIPSAPIPVTLPNVAELEPGAQAEIWWFDGSPMGGSGQWQLAGLGTVSADGRSVASNPGVGIPRFCGVCGLVSLNCPPPPVPPQPPPMADPPACGNPIDLYTGQALATAAGLSCGGLTPIELNLRYHPVDAFNNRAGTIASTGFGWVLEHDLAFLPFAGPQKRLVLPGSRFVHFIDDGSGQYRAPDDPRFSGAVASELPDSTSERPRWQIRLKDGTHWQFDAFPGIAGLIRGGPPLFLTAITDAAGNTQTLTRRADGRLTAIGRPERSLRLQYGAHGFVEQVSDDAGRRLQLAYNARQRLESLTDADGRTIRYAYAGDDALAPDPVCGPQPDGGQRLTRIDYPGRATPTLNDYGIGRRVLRQRTGRGEYRFAYHLSGACVTHIARPGQICQGAACPQVDSWEHHQAGWRLHGGRVVATTVTLPDGRTQTTRFNARGLPTETLDALGQRHTRSYDARQQLVAETDVLGRHWRYEVDDHGQRTAITDPLGRRTELTYDPRWGTPTSITRLDDDGRRHVSQWQYHPQHGQPIRHRDAAGRLTTFEHDARGQLQQLGAALERRWRFGYHPAGDLASLTDPLGRTTRVGTDAIGRLTERTDALGHTRRLAYAGSDVPINSTDALGRTLQFGQDAAGRLAAVTNAAGVTIDTRTYDDGDRLIEQRDAHGAATHASYDAGGRLVQRTDRNGHVTRYGYDAAGQLATIDDGASRQTLRHDAAGRLIEWHEQAADGSGQTLAFAYDAADRLTVVDSRSPGLNSRVRSVYDALDRRTARYVSLNGGPEQVTRYQWNDAGQLTALEAHGQRTIWTYDAAGRPIGKVLPNGIEQVLTWDAADQLLRLTYTSAGGQVLDDLRYAYDAAGRRIRKESLGPSLHDTPMTATYDAANRMTALVLQPGSAQERRYALTYDAAGQLVEKVRVEASGQALTGARAAHTRYTWNRRGQLEQIVSSEGEGDDAQRVTSRYRYDPLGRRMARVVERRDGRAPPTAQTVRYVYDGAQAVAEVRESAEHTSSMTTHLLTGLQLDELIARHTDGRQQVALTDALGSVLALTDDTQQVTGSWAYAPYGETVAIGPGIEQPLQYTGREHDEGASAESGSAQQVYYYRARYYAPGMKRFVSEDPIGIAGGINVYGYVEGNPVNMVDPTGEVGIVGGLIGAGVEIALQGYKNYRDDCDIFDMDNYDWWDVGMAGAAGALAPGLLNVGRTVWKSGNAIRTIASQSANTVNRAAKNANRIAAHSKQMKDIVTTQAAYQGGRTIAKAINGNRSACGCSD